jgi:integrase
LGEIEVLIASGGSLVDFRLRQVLYPKSIECMKPTQKNYSRPAGPRLSADALAIAKPAITAAVDAAKPISSGSREIFTDHLVSFLASNACSSWDQEWPPAIEELITEAHIEAHLQVLMAAKMSTWLCRGSRSSLRRIKRGLTGSQPLHEAVLKKDWPIRSSHPLLAPLLRVADMGSSFRELHGCWNVLNHQLGRSNKSFANLGDHLADAKLLQLSELIEASASTDRVVTLSGDECGFFRVMAQVIAPGSLVGTMSQKVTTQSTSPVQGITVSGGKKSKSNRAVLRDAQAKTQRVNAQACLEDLDAADWPQWGPLDPELKAWALRYRPEKTCKGDWSVLQPVFLRLYSAAQPKTFLKARTIGMNLVPYLKWAVNKRPMDQLTNRLEIAEIGTIELVNEWVASQQGTIPDASLATRRSEVKAVIKALHPDSAPIRLPYQPVAGPYQRMEIEHMTQTARHQSEDRKAVQLASMIALCAGAGLQPREVGGVRPSDLQRIELPDAAWTYLVAVRVGNHPRSVPMLQQYAKFMEWVLKLNRRRLEADLTLLPPRERGATSYVVAASDTADGKEQEILATRLRTTWLVTLMQAEIPLATLLHTAGLTSARTLCDLIAYCEPIPEERALKLLAQADVVADKQVR